MLTDFVKIEEIRALIPDRIKDSHKGTYGRVAIMGGATEYSGAIRLASFALAALRSGCGMSTVAVPKYLVDIVSKNILEQMIYPINDISVDGKKEITFDKDNIDGLLKKVDVLTIGMGFGKSGGAKNIVKYVLENYDKRLALDADALNIISEDTKILDDAKAKRVLTPHMMEFTRLLNGDKEKKYELKDVESDKENLAMAFAKKHNVVLLLKGPITIITDGNKIKFVNRGTPGMSTAGSGDVLSGILTGFLGYIEDVFEATVVSAFVNGMAGEKAASEIGEISMIASDTINAIPKVIKEIKLQDT